MMLISERKTNEQKDKNKRKHDNTPPSHILQDGRFIYLPEPTEKERSIFLQRSIARHNLLNEEASKEEEEPSAEKEQEATEPRVHPLAVASARLQANGIAELSKAINLSGLVHTGEFFSLSNVVDSTLLESVTKENTASAKNNANPSTNNANNSTATSTASTRTDDRLQSIFLTTRKKQQFIRASQTLTLYTQRLASSVTAQQVIDRRLFEKRSRWRLVAPEHGTRAKPHPVQATEVVAMDVDVYDRDRTGGGVHQTRKVPRYATLELVTLKDNVESWKKQHQSWDNKIKENTFLVDSPSTTATTTTTAATTTETDDGPITKAEPFAVLDPTMGKLDVDFDPDKVPMLTLQLDIEKDSTGFCQSACLEASSAAVADDETVVVALQHSLFCASLFESIRNELVSNHHVVVWLSSAMETNYLPPPHVMAGGTGVVGGRGAICVIHSHEGEVKVQLDSEYTLTIKLVEASSSASPSSSISNTTTDENVIVDESAQKTTSASGSQSPEQLLVLCRALLLHAQDVYHKYCIATTSTSSRNREHEVTKTNGHVLKSKEAGPPPARILQSTVGLGAKWILDRNVRKALERTKVWLKQRHENITLNVDWLPLSVFHLHAHFVITCLGLMMDVNMERDTLSITRFGNNGEYRKVDFQSHREFEIFLKMELEKAIV